MANRQTSRVGELQRFTARASIQSVPDFGVDTGAAGRVLASVGGSLSQRLARMADHAAAREGERAGMEAGQAAGEKFLEREQQTAAAEAAPRKGAEIPIGPGEASGGPSDLDPTPLQLRHDNTIRGEAFDRAAIQSYGWRMQEGLANSIGEAFQANKASPAGFEAAVSKIVAEFREDGLVNEPELRELFDKTLNDRLQPARLAVAANHEAQVRAAAREAAVASGEAIRKELERNAYALGANPAADWMLKGSIERALADVDAAVASGTYSPKEGERQKRAIQNTVLNARTAGTFDALPTPEEKLSFAQSILEGYASGKGPYAELSLEEAKELSGSLSSKATAAANKQTAEAKAEAAAVKSLVLDDVASLAGAGTGLDPAAGLTPDRVRAALGETAYQGWMADRDVARRSWEATAGMEGETPAAIAARLEAMQPKPGTAGYDAASQIYAGAVKQAKAVLEERRTDPLGQANRAGIVALEPINTATPEGLTASLGARRQQAAIVSQTYGTPLVVFRPEERQALATALGEHPDLLPEFARSANEALGPLAPAALAELSEAGPALAHAAGLGMATDDNSVADDIARVITGRKAGTFKVKMPTDNVLGDAAGRELGDVFAQNDTARAAVVDTANLLFEKEANTLGFDPGQVNKDGSAAQAAYARAIDRALGARTVAGVQYGGLDQVNGRTIVAPTFLPAGRAAELVTALRPSDLAFLPPIVSANGVPVTAADLRGAQLVTVGNGLYRVALGDPQSADPRFVMGADGGYWTLDLGTIEQLHGLPEFTRPGASPADLAAWLRSQATGADAP